MPGNDVYNRMVDVTHAYLGPAANRFVERQVRSHLHKEPEAVTQGDLAGLIDWMKMAISLLTDDRTVVEAYVQQLRQLANEAARAKAGGVSAKPLFRH